MAALARSIAALYESCELAARVAQLEQQQERRR